MLYIDTGQPEKAKARIKQLQQSGIHVPTEALKELGM